MCHHTTTVREASRKGTNQETKEGARGEATARLEICQLGRISGGEKANALTAASISGTSRQVRSVKSGRPAGSRTTFLAEAYPADFAQLQKQCSPGAGVSLDSWPAEAQQNELSEPVNNSE